MTKLTNEEREEARYEAWVEGGGPQRREEEHKELARAALRDLEDKGYRVLEETMYRPDGDPARMLEAVVRMHDDLYLLRWNSFNKGFMEKADIGWTVFKG